MPNPTPALLPCPFCGAPAETVNRLAPAAMVRDQVRIQCREGCVHTTWLAITPLEAFNLPGWEGSFLAENVEKLRATWNRRVAAGGYPALPKGLHPVTEYGAFEYLRELAIAGNAHAEVALQAWADLARRHPPTQSEKRG